MLEKFFAEYGGMEFELPKIAGVYEGRNVVICGGAACVWDDLEAYGCRRDYQRGSVQKEGHDFLVVNQTGITFPGNIEHWYSNEPPVLQKYIAARRPEYMREFSGPAHTHSCNRGAKWRWPFGGHGTSGLGAILTAVGLGYDAITVCGIPLDDSPHNGEPHWRKCRFETAEAASPVNGGPNIHWKRAIEAFGDRITFMSGRPRQWSGYSQSSSPVENTGPNTSPGYQNNLVAG